MKFKLIIVMALLLFPMVSSTPLQELMSEDVTSMTLEISQNKTIIDFKLDTSGTSFDEQTIWNEEHTLGMTTFISYLLNGWVVDGEHYTTGISGIAKVKKGTNYVEFENVKIGFPAQISEYIDEELEKLGFDFTLSQINSDSSILTNYTKEHPFKEDWDFSSTFTKGMYSSDYHIELDRGFGDIKENQLSEIEDIIDGAVYYFNPQQMINLFLPFDFDLSKIEFTEYFEFEVLSATGINIEEGIFMPVITIRRGNETVTKDISLILKEIVYEPDYDCLGEQTLCEGTIYYTCSNRTWISSGEVDGFCGYETPKTSSSGGGSSRRKPRDKSQEIIEEPFINKICDEWETKCEGGIAWICSGNKWLEDVVGECEEKIFILPEEDGMSLGSFLLRLLIGLGSAILVVYLVIKLLKKDGGGK